MLSEQDKREFKQKISTNKHEVFVVSFDEMDNIIKSSTKPNIDSIKERWSQIKGPAETGANYYRSAGSAVVLAKLVGDLGGFTTKVVIKTYNGKPHIILKGNPGLRKILTGTKYGINNPKIVKMGLGHANAISGAKSGGIFTIVLLTAFRVVDYFLTDSATLHQLIGTIATDVVKVGIATGATIGAIAVGVAYGVTFAIGPILAVVLVGIGVSMLLDDADKRFEITKKIIEGLDETSFYVNNTIQKTKRHIVSTVERAAGSVIDYAVDSAKKIIINTTKHTLDKFLSGRVRPR